MGISLSKACTGIQRTFIPVKSGEGEVQSGQVGFPKSLGLNKPPYAKGSMKSYLPS